MGYVITITIILYMYVLYEFYNLITVIFSIYKYDDNIYKN